jgi:hypothetical protein
LTFFVVVEPYDSDFLLLFVEMMHSLTLEDKLNGATNFRGTHLYIFLLLYHEGVHKRCTLGERTFSQPVMMSASMCDNSKLNASTTIRL